MSLNQNNSTSDSEDDQECKLFVGNVPVELCQKHVLYTIFMNEGQVKEVYCHSPQPNAKRTWSFVTYYSKRDAEKAIKAYHGKAPHFLKIEVSKERKDNLKGKPQWKAPDADQTYKNHDQQKRNHEGANTKYKSARTVDSTSGEGNWKEETKVESPIPAELSCEPFQDQEKLSNSIFMEVVVLHQVGPFKCWVCLKVNYAQVILLSNELAKCESSVAVLTPSIGSYCIAKYEDAWYRGKILSIKPQISVFYIDFGNVTTVAPEDLRKLPDIARKMKSQAMLIQLAPGTSEKYENLSEESELVVKMIGRKGDTFIACVEEEENEVVVEDNKERTERKADTVSIASVSLHKSCILTAVLENEVYVRPANIYCFEMLAVIQNELNNDCVNSVALENPPVVGDMLAAKFSDGSFYRAVVKKLKHAEGIEVQYIDFGNIEYVKDDDLKPLSENISHELCLVVKVEIQKVVSNLSDENVKLVLDQYVEAGTVLHVDHSGDGNVRIRAPILNVIGRIGKMHLGPETSETSKAYLAAESDYVDNILTLRDMALERWPQGEVVEIFVYEVMCHNIIAAALVNSEIQQQLRNILQPVIDEYCYKEPPYCPEKGELCLAYIDEFWYRCVCKGKCEQRIGKEIEVILLDTKETHGVKYKDVRKMSKQFTKLPMTGVECVIEMKEGLTKKDKFAVIGYLTFKNKLEVTVLQSDLYGALVKVQEVDEFLED